MRFRLVTPVLLPMIFAVLLAPIVTGCKKASVDPMPASGSVAGWEKSGDTRTFAAKDLWQYMDGGADQFVSAGVVSTSTSDYKYQGQIEATVDVHTMKDSAGAKNIFDANFSKDGKPALIGDAGIASSQSVAFRKGPYVVNVVTYQGGKDASQPLMQLAQAIAGKL